MKPVIISYGVWHRDRKLYKNLYDKFGFPSNWQFLVKSERTLELKMTRHINRLSHQSIHLHLYGSVAIMYSSKYITYILHRLSSSPFLFSHYIDTVTTIGYFKTNKILTLNPKYSFFFCRIIQVKSRRVHKIHISPIRTTDR